jgi:hypothetical protein
MRALSTVHYVTGRSFACSGLLSVPMSMYSNHHALRQQSLPPSHTSLTQSIILASPRHFTLADKNARTKYNKYVQYAEVNIVLSVVSLNCISDTNINSLIILLYKSTLGVKKLKNWRGFAHLYALQCSKPVADSVNFFPLSFE